MSAIESDVNKLMGKGWTDIDRLMFIQKSNLTNKIKLEFFLPGGKSVLLYGCTCRL